jgi:hypothetical protein
VAGKIKQIIDKIVNERAKGNEVIASTTRTKIVLKGIRPSAYNENSEDNSVVIAKLHEIAKEMGVQL